jgi:2-C-methyl-D-erythritol 4-phosphate cytidylyltransferase
MPAVDISRTCSAILVAAGSSRRMGFDKLAAELAGMSVLRRTVEAFMAAESISEVVVVCPEERWKLLDGGNFSKPVRRVDGGENRQDSVVAGLSALSLESNFVAVHDGARPLISPEDIDECVASATEYRAAALSRRVTETLKRADPLDFSTEGVSREHLWFMETPQVFEIRLLVDSYADVSSRNLTVTDEVSVMEAVGVRVKLVESKHPNIKITTPADLALAEAILR